MAFSARLIAFSQLSNEEMEDNFDDVHHVCVNILANDFPAPVSHSPLTLQHVQDLRDVFRLFVDPSLLSPYCTAIQLHKTIEENILPCTTIEDLVYVVHRVFLMASHTGRQFLIQLPANEPFTYHDSLSSTTRRVFRKRYWNILRALATLAQTSFEFNPTYRGLRVKRADIVAIAPMFLSET